MVLAEQNRSNMNKNNLIRFAKSLVFLPVMAGTLSFGEVPKASPAEIPQVVFVQKQNIDPFDFFPFNREEVEKAKTLKVQAEAIDAYFRARNMPLEGTGMIMAEAAYDNELDWRLLPALAVRESTGGINKCKTVEHNFFGWGSCKYGFDSDEEAIEKVARNLGGNNPKTAYHYAGKDTKEILQKYNPPSVVPDYANQVMSIMDAIGEPVVVDNSVA